MATMGRYCKAYPVRRLREFSGWREELSHLNTDRKDGREIESVLTDDDILYLQEDYTVTDGVFQDENMVFDTVTDEWKAFCHDQLGFSIPGWITSDDAPSTTAEVPAGSSVA